MAVDGAGDVFIVDADHSLVEVQTRSVNFGSVNVGAGTSPYVELQHSSSVALSSVNTSDPTPVPE